MESPSPFVAQVVAAIHAANASFAPSAAAPPSATEKTRAELLAKLEATQDNDTRFALADAINNLPPEGAF